MCCKLYTYSWTVTEGLSLPVLATSLALISIAGLGVLLVKSSLVYKRQLEQGYALSQAPVLAIRSHRETSSGLTWILPFYQMYISLLALFMLLQLVGSVLDEPPILIYWLNVLLCGLCDYFDLLLLVYLTFPRIDLRRKVFGVLFCGVIGVGVIILCVLLPGGYSSVRPCLYCSQHFPVPSMGYLYSAQAVFCLIIIILSSTRVLSKAYRPRPMARVAGAFWLPIYGVSGVTILLMHHLDAGYSFSGAGDWGFCLLGVVIVFYFIFLIPMLYVVILKDSRYVMQERLDARLGPLAGDSEGDRVRQEAVALLTQRSSYKSGSRLARLLADVSLAVVADAELIRGHRLGRGAFGEVNSNYYY